MSSEGPTGRPITAEDLFKLHLVSDPQVSPDGTRVAYAVSRLDEEADEYRAAIWLVPTAGGEPTHLTAGTGRDLAPRWSPDGSRIAFVSNRPGESAPEVAAAGERPAGGDQPKGAAKRAAARTKAGAKPKTQIWVIPV